MAWAVALLFLLGPAAELLGQSRPTDDLIRSYQARVARRPDDLRSYARLGQAYILKARETGDPTYHDLAEKALARCLELSPDPVTAARATTDLAVVQTGRHQFREGLATGQKALGYGSGELNAYGLIGDAHVELGEYEQAEAAYEKMKVYTHDVLAWALYKNGRAADAVAPM